MCIAAWTWQAHPAYGLLLLFNRDEYHSRQGPLEYATEIAKEADQYNGFNLVLADVHSGTMVYISNKPGDAPVVQTVSPGCHVLSNAAIDSPWPKVLRLGQSFNRFLAAHDDAEVSLKQMVEELMTDTVKADRSAVPDTGVDPDWEYQLSSIFIDTKKGQARYGTRSMAAIGVKLDGEIRRPPNDSRKRAEGAPPSLPLSSPKPDKTCFSRQSGSCRAKAA
uniref:Uncharacterized protein n=1 Tax=Aegilops tauschii TaxID=37682 RepID=R7W4I6_AEGTA